MLYKDMKDARAVFALDIGTRSVVGILGKKENNKIHIQDMAVEFHEKRVMYNGQIHDIEGVADIVRKVKATLEERAGYPLEDVALAVAGRSLKTNRVTIERQIDSTKYIEKDLVHSLEIEGLQKAQHELESQLEDNTKYFCVGHTIIHYYINDGIIKNPLGHKAEKIKMDILATFLPQIVIDSLYAVTSRLNLEVRYMTLEPIAAIEIAIPENTRLLNLALVDIGAGTSDIAITKDGTIVAYGMTSKAGDSITEAIAREYLLDFDTAESLKVNLSKEKIQRFYDIVGMYYEMESEEILSRIEGSIKEVAKLIAANIMEQNGKPPSAVFLIGGGSQIPNLNTFIAEELDLPKERVVVRGIETIKDDILIADEISGPEYITPIGILAKSITNQELDFIEIYVNNQRVKLFQTKDLKVKDALVLIGFNPKNLVPKRGKSIDIMINGNPRTLHGKYGEPAKIYVNRKLASIESSIRDGDLIDIHPAEEGEAALYSLKDILPLEHKLFINGKIIRQVHSLTINNESVKEETIIKEGDHIQYYTIDSVKNLCQYIDIQYEDYVIKINDKVASYEDKIKNMDDVKIEIKNKGADISNKTDDDMNVDGGKDGHGLGEVSAGPMEATKEKILVKCNGEFLEIPLKNGVAIFVDIFDHIDFDRSKVQGRLVLQLNGRDANYTDILRSGDEIRVYWDK